MKIIGLRRTEPKGEIPDRFYKALTQVGSIAALLLLSHLGIALKDKLPVLNAELEDPSKIPYVLGAVLVYSLVLLWFRWVSMDPVHRRNRGVRLELTLSSALAVAALWPLLRELNEVARASGLPLGSVATLIALGIIVGEFAGFFLELPFLLRRREFAHRVELPRIPIMTRLNLLFSLSVTAITAILITVLSKGWDDPLIKVWPWLFFVPMASVFLPDAGKEALRLLLRKEEGWLGTRKWTKIQEVYSFLEANDALKREREPKNETFLEWAARIGRVADVKRVIQDGANPNLTCFLGQSPLMISIEGMDPEIPLYLIGQGADVNHRCLVGRTPLLLATVIGWRAVVKALIDQGADVNAREGIRWPWGTLRTPLYYASTSGDLEIVRDLLNAGADPNIASKSGITPLMVAVRGQHDAIVKMLLEHKADPNTSVEDKGTTPLMNAAAIGREDFVAMLLEHGADPTKTDKIGRSAIDIAQGMGHGSIAAMLRKAARSYQGAV